MFDPEISVLLICLNCIPACIAPKRGPLDVFVGDCGGGGTNPDGGGGTNPDGGGGGGGGAPDAADAVDRCGGGGGGGGGGG